MKVVSVLILLFLSTISFAQKTGAGYFGKHHFLNLELSPMLRLYETGHKQNNYSFSHDWQTRSKIGIEFGHQNKNNSQWRIGLSNYEIPLAVLNSERSTDVSNGVTKSTTSLFRAFGNNIQFGLAGKITSKD